MNDTMTQYQDQAEMVDLIGALFVKMLSVQGNYATTNSALVRLIEKFSEILSSEANKGQAIRALHYWKDNAERFGKRWQIVETTPPEPSLPRRRDPKLVLTDGSLDLVLSMLKCGPPPNDYEYRT